MNQKLNIKNLLYLITLLITHNTFAHGGVDHGEADPGNRGPHDGIIAPFSKIGALTAGYLELKLHDDKGDLEIWFAKDPKCTQPFDLPLTTSIKIAFIDKSMKTIELKVRNSKKNEDEDGNSTTRNNSTNYFIYPGESNIDSNWLMGKNFQSSVIVSFVNNRKKYRSSMLTLTPHNH